MTDNITTPTDGHQHKPAIADEETRAIFQIIHTDLEAGVIDESLLNAACIEQGHRGEAGRLALLSESIDYNSITSLRLEFQNLLRIDHLWVMPNLQKLSLKFNKIERIENIHMLTKLRELDLSFNCVERIERLDALVELEVLTLFGNRIERLENLDELKKMLILSVGNNRIDTFDGIERLRFMTELRSLNLEGNPIAQRPLANEGTFRTYIAAFLPTLKYYNYKFIMDEERNVGKELFSYELAKMEEAQSNEVAERQRIAKELADEQRLSSSFVELLNDHQLFDSFWAEDEDGRLLLSIGEEAVNLANDFRAEVFQLTQQIYELGLAKHEIRLQEIAMFETCVCDAKKHAQEIGINLVNDLLPKQTEMFAHQKALFMRLLDVDNKEINNIDELEAQVDANRDEFMALMESAWFDLMASEARLFESIEEANTMFGHAISEMLNEFIEAAQGIFVQIRDCECNFSESMYELAGRYFAEQAAAGNAAAIPEALQECLEDKDAILNFIGSSRDVHMQMIDAREDRLVTRARSWVAELIGRLHSEEIQRNRNKVMEINYFLDKPRMAFVLLREDVQIEFEES